MLVPAQNEREFMTTEEGAFYGNIFADPEEPLQWYACEGRDQADGETGALVLRDCAEPDPANPGYTLCGFIFTGTCMDSSPDVPSAYSCAKFDEEDLFYWKCHDSPGLGTWPHTKKFKEVITSYVSSPL
jgi:hypothetical protein